MQRLFSIALSRHAEFSVVAIANVAKQEVRFQGLLNGIPFTQGFDYEKVRARVMRAVDINRPQTNESLS